MIIGDFYIVGITIYKMKANPPLIIYCNSMLTLSVSAQCVQSVTGR